MVNTNTEVTRRGHNGSALQQRDETRTFLRPPVDIFEDDEGITVHADMPGVSKDRLTVRIEGNNLILEGKADVELTEEMQALYADIRSNAFRRAFVLSRELDTEKIDAHLKDGVLTVRIPKRQELRPRRIEVKAA